MDTSKVLLCTGEIENHSSSMCRHRYISQKTYMSFSMCRHRYISQKTYMSFVWACRSTVNDLCLALYVRPSLFVFLCRGWFLLKLLFLSPCTELRNKFDFFWGYYSSTCSAISQQIRFDFLKSKGGNEPAIFFLQRDCDRLKLWTTANYTDRCFFWGRNWALWLPKKIGFLFSPFPV